MALNYFLTNSNSVYAAQETRLFLHNAVGRFMLSGIKVLLFVFAKFKDCITMFFQYLR